MSEFALSILLVEDNPGDAFLLQEILEGLDNPRVLLRHEEELQTALERVSQEHFDLMLLDLSLPDVQGVETVIRASAAARDLPLVVLTGLDDEDVALRAMQEGAQDYLVKGKVDGPLLRRSIRYALERKRAEDHMRRLIHEQLARAEAEAAERRSRLLSEASHLLASTLDEEAALAKMARRVVESWADGVLVDRLQRGTEVRRLEVWSRDPDAAPPQARTLLLEPEDLAAQVLQQGTAQLVEDFPAAQRRLRLPEGWPGTARSILCMPLSVRGRTLGTITFLTRYPGRRFKQEDLAVARELAGRAALAIENAQLHHAREEVLRVVSHDLRTPLSVVRGNVELLEQGGISREDGLPSLRRAVDHMERLLQDLLDATRLDAGTLTLRLGQVGVATLLEDAEEMLRPGAEAQGVTLRMPDAQDLPFLRADRDRVLQVLWNLVGNAIKFTPRGGSVTVEVAPEEGALRFAVTDTGPGIPEKDVPHVFDRFWQANKADRRGAGLGLSIARGLVEAHGGRLWLQSVERQGTTFYFTLPQAHAQPSDSIARVG